MTREEFESLARVKVSEEEYDAIETVYVYHPSISDTMGKQQIANLYSEYGYRIILDMLPSATKAQSLERELFDARIALENLEIKYKAFKNGAAF